jgi:4-amino-4-deoxy-L-arabinose transferase-like glycosyltransferase
MKKQAAPSFFDNRTAVVFTVIAVALLARVLFMYLFYNTFYWISIWSDSATYNQWARRIVTSGDWIGQEPFFMTPLYPYFLAVLYKTFGLELFVVRLTQSLLGVATAVGIYFIGEHFFTRRAGFFAGLIAALYGPFLLCNNLVLVETLKVVLLVATLVLLIEAHRRNRRSWWLGAGVTLGLAILGRATDFLIVPVVFLWILLLPKWTWRKELKNLAVLLLGVVFVVLPVTVRNYAVSGEFVFITSNGGLNFYLGNNPKAVGVYYNVDQLDLANDPDGRVYAETILGKPLRPSEVSQFWMKRAVEFVRTQPFDFLELVGKKALLFFHYKEISQLGYNYQFIKETSIPLLAYFPTFLIVGPLAILGLALGLRRWRELALLYGFAVAEFMSVVVFFVTDRYRLSAMPFLIVFAGFAFVSVVEFWKKKSQRSLTTAAGILLIAVLTVTVFNYEVIDEFSTEYEYVGLMYFDAKRYGDAYRAFKQAQQYRDSYHIHNNIGNVRLAAGDPRAALAEYQMGHQLNPKQAISVFNIGTAYVKMQRWEAALEAFTRAIEINPRFPPAYLNKGLTFYIMGRYTEALEYMQAYTRMERDTSKLTTVWRDIENLKMLIGRQNGM